MMKKVALLLVLFLAQAAMACHCLTVNEAKKEALKTNKFVILHFSKFFMFDDDASIQNSTMPEEGKEIFRNFIYVCMPRYATEQYYRQYNVKTFPQMLIIDANGRELYRLNYDNLGEILEALIDFTLPNTFLGNELNQFAKKKSYNTAMRVAQKYFDYSLLVDAKFRPNIYKVGQSYLAEAESLLLKNDADYGEKDQKLQLMKLFHWGYEKNFSLLDEKLAEMQTAKIHPGNLGIFYFLKYLSAKAQQSADFLSIQAQAQTIEGFDSYAKKAELILTDRA